MYSLKDNIGTNRYLKVSLYMLFGLSAFIVSYWLDRSLDRHSIISIITVLIMVFFLFLLSMHLFGLSYREYKSTGEKKSKYLEEIIFGSAMMLIMWGILTLLS